jgi:sulfur relay (sulfurtransferase) complex TusBCD TusD component (DsrE family)
MKFFIVLYPNNLEMVWNAFRLAIFLQIQGDLVKIFLLAQGVEVSNLQSDKVINF